MNKRLSFITIISISSILMACNTGSTQKPPIDILAIPYLTTDINKKSFDLESNLYNSNNEEWNKKNYPERCFEDCLKFSTKLTNQSGFLWDTGTEVQISIINHCKATKNLEKKLFEIISKDCSQNPLHLGKMISSSGNLLRFQKPIYTNPNAEISGYYIGYFSSPFKSFAPNETITFKNAQAFKLNGCSINMVLFNSEIKPLCTIQESSETNQSQNNGSISIINNGHNNLISILCQTVGVNIKLINDGNDNIIEIIQ